MKPWNSPKLVSDKFVPPTANQEDLDAFTGLTEEYRKMFEEFHSFFTDLISNQCDKWVVEYWLHGLFYMSTKEGALEICFWEGINSLQQEHIQKQIWDALNRTPNRYITLEGAH